VRDNFTTFLLIILSIVFLLSLFFVIHHYQEKLEMCGLKESDTIVQLGQYICSLYNQSHIETKSNIVYMGKQAVSGVIGIRCNNKIINIQFTS